MILERDFFMHLDYSALANAIKELEKSLNFATSDMAEDEELFKQFRNSVIQCFEFTYELSHKMLKRYLKEISPSPEHIETATFAHIIRTGNEQGLLRSDWVRWKAYRQARNDSSHTYNEDKAADVYAIAADFLEEARFLYHQLMRRSES
jgi:nucleotidyltransferase substrate binding protein (TIGR01987 family)